MWFRFQPLQNQMELFENCSIEVSIVKNNLKLKRTVYPIFFFFLKIKSYLLESRMATRHQEIVALSLKISSTFSLVLQLFHMTNLVLQLWSCRNRSNVYGGVQFVREIHTSLSIHKLLTSSTLVIQVSRVFSWSPRFQFHQFWFTNFPSIKFGPQN